MTLALIARCDNGGLGTMTWEAWRHLRPARTLVVRTAGPACGRPDPTRYAGGTGEVRATAGQPTPADAAWLVDGASVVYTAETWYSANVPKAARRARCRTALHVMPEYWQPAVTADVLLAPTSWLPPPGARFLPVPVARDRFHQRRIDGVDTLYHIASPAQDRNGTDLLLAALDHVRRPCRLLIRESGRDRTPERSERIGRVCVEWLPHHHGPYWSAWPAEAQALVMPRRFAGLSLPMQEAAALGLPVIALDRPPEEAWLPPEARVPAAVAGRVRTWRSCQVDYWDADPIAVAAAIDALTGDPALATRLAARSREWADTLDWPRWTDTYRQVLDT